MIRIKITERGALPSFVKRKLAGMKRGSFRLLGEFWHRTLRPKHFTNAGAREYRYDPRQGERGSSGGKGFKRSYTGRKLRRFGHTRPLVWTGESQDLTRIRDVRATSKRVRVVMRAPRLNFRRKGKNKTMREELTTISPREVTQLTKLATRDLERRIKGIRTQRTVRA